MDRLTVDKRATMYRGANQGVLGADGASRDRPIARDFSKPSAFKLHSNTCIGRSTNSGCVLSYSIQHRLDIRRRASDDAQNLAGRGLLLQRLGEFLEQPHVLNGDDRLVSEGFEQLDLGRREGAHFCATCEQSSNEFPLLKKGSSQEGAGVAAGTHHWEIILRAGVGNVERAVLAHPAKMWLIDTDLSADHA